MSSRENSSSCSTGCFCGGNLQLQEGSWGIPVHVLLSKGAILYTTGNWFSFVENFAGPLTFKFGLLFFFFSLSLNQLFMCISSYKIISLSSSNWLLSTHSYITIVSEVARSYHGHSQQNRAGPGAAHREKRIWWPRNHLVITESGIQFINNILSLVCAKH